MFVAVAPPMAKCWLTTWIVQVFEHCEHHRGEPLPITDEANAGENRRRTTDIGELGEWDQKFVTVDQALSEIILTANQLDVKPSLCVPLSIPVALSFLVLLPSGVGCKTVADVIEGKTREEIRKLQKF